METSVANSVTTTPSIPVPPESAVFTVPATELTEREKMRAATNAPELAVAQFTLGGRTFPIVDLEYDDLLTFIALFEPVASMFMGTMKQARGLGGSEQGFSLSAIVKYAGKELPEMVRLCCKPTDPTITVEQIKQLGRSPFALAAIVKKQIEQNKLADQVADFFEQILPAMSQAGQ